MFRLNGTKWHVDVTSVRTISPDELLELRVLGGAVQGPASVSGSDIDRSRVPGSHNMSQSDGLSPCLVRHYWIKLISLTFITNAELIYSLHFIHYIIHYGHDHSSTVWWG